MAQILTPEEYLRAPYSTSLYRPQAPAENTVWRNPATGGDEIFSHGTWQPLQISGVLGITNGGTGATDAAGARSALGLGNMAQQASNAVNITGGTLAGITSFTMAAGNIILDTGTGTKIGTSTSQKLAFYNATPVVQQSDGAALTNNVTSGGTTNTVADYADLSVYANDAAAIRNNLYQLARKLKIVDDALRTYGLLS